MDKFIIFFILLSSLGFSQLWNHTEGIYGGDILSMAKIKDTAYIGGEDIFSSKTPQVKWQFSYSGSEIKQIFINPVNPKIAYASDYCKPCVITDVRKTTDGGNYWETKESLVGEGDIFYNPSNDYLYAFANKQLTYSKGGISWEPINFPSLTLNDLAFGESETLFAASDSLYKSDDNGNKWKGLLKITGRYVTFCNGNLYTDNKFSPNNGTTWIQMNISGTVKNIIPGGVNKLYANTSEGMFKSTDDGMSWTILDKYAEALFAEGDTVYYKKWNTGLTKMNTNSMEKVVLNNGYFNGKDFKIKSDYYHAYLLYNNTLYESPIMTNNWKPVLTANIEGDFAVDRRDEVIVSTRDSLYFKGRLDTVWKSRPAEKVYKTILPYYDGSLILISEDDYIYYTNSITSPFIERGKTYGGKLSVVYGIGIVLIREDSLFVSDDDCASFEFKHTLPFKNATTIGHIPSETFFTYPVPNTDGMNGLARYDLPSSAIVFDTLIKSITMNLDLQMYAIKNREVYFIAWDGSFQFFPHQFETELYSMNSTIGRLYMFVEDKGIYWHQIASDVKKDENLVSGFSLKQNYPNPFNPTTTIDYSLNKGGVVNIIVYDMLGSEVLKLENGYKEPGSYKVQLNGKSLSSGTYFYKLSVDGQSQIRKMILLK